MIKLHWGLLKGGLIEKISFDMGAYSKGVLIDWRGLNQEFTVFKQQCILLVRRKLKKIYHDKHMAGREVEKKFL